MRRRVRVYGSTAVLSLITGLRGEADAGLIMNGADECLNLADQLIDAANKIVDNEKNPKKESKPGFYRSPRRR